MKFKDIPQYTRHPNYHIDVHWSLLEDTLARYAEPLDPGTVALDLDPDFQRAHVWTEEQQVRYVEYILRGGHSGKEIYFNHPNWNGNYRGTMVLVDGKQRLEAVRKFLRNELAIFDGHYFKDFEERLPLEASFSVNINDLKTRKDVLQWYIDMNDGGIAHTTDEIEHVRKLLEQEQ